MKLLTTLFAIMGSSCYLSASTIIIYQASLTGPNESPTNLSPGIGTALVTIDTLLHTMQVQVSFSGLTGTTMASHIHSPTPTPGTGTAGVATTTPTFTAFPLGVTSGTYDHTFDLTLASSYNPAFVTANGGTTAGAEAALLAGLAADDAYLNIHSSTFQGGEIRGFLLAIPEPATMGLTGLALAGLIFAQRRRISA
jgi:hypothetical protein